MKKSILGREDFNLLISLLKGLQEVMKTDESVVEISSAFIKLFCIMRKSKDIIYIIEHDIDKVSFRVGR